MNSDNCPISQEFTVSHFQISFPCNHHNHGIETISPLHEDEVNKVTFAEIDRAQFQQQNSISSAEMKSDLRTTLISVQEDHISNNELYNNTTDVIVGDVIIDEKQSLLPSNQKTHFSNTKNKAEEYITSQSEKRGVSNCNDSVLACESLEVSDASNIEYVSLQEVSHNDSDMKAGDHHSYNISEIDVAVGENQHLSALTTETVKCNYDSSAFIGPVLPSFKEKKSQEVSGDSSFTYPDTSLLPPSCAYANNLSFTDPDDSRYNLSVDCVPSLIATASMDFQGISENFLRGCKWSPDGSSVLTNSNDNCLRVFYPFDNISTREITNHKQMVSRVNMKECSQIYDYAWHPQMSFAQADYGRIACACSGIPIHLWDVGTGQIVANYRAYDQFDEITPAYSLAFSLDGTKIYSGYNKTIRIFDAEYPVRSCKTVRTYNSQRRDGQIGIVSCFTFSPDGNGLYVAGSYSRHIGIYDSACDKLVCLMQGQHGGVTHLMFSPDATKLYSGGRKDAEILCWDMRNMDKILFSVLRDVKTNQRIYFDMSQSGRYLISGNSDGTVAFWDTQSPVEEISGDSFLKPCSQFQAHDDCVNGVSFNHQHNLLATASGQRHFHNFDDTSDSAEDESMEGTELWDYSLRLWQIPMFV